jgi:hypothetical protein
VNRKFGRSPNVVVSVFPWATLKQFLLGRQCKARLPRTDNFPYWGRCELVKDHICDHAMERGFNTPQWKIEIVSG